MSQKLRFLTEMPFSLPSVLDNKCRSKAQVLLVDIVPALEVIHAYIVPFRQLSRGSDSCPRYAFFFSSCLFFHLPRPWQARFLGMRRVSAGVKLAAFFNPLCLAISSMLYIIFGGQGIEGFIALELMLLAARGLHRLHRCVGLAPLLSSAAYAVLCRLRGAWQQNGLAGFQAVYAGICNLPRRPRGILLLLLIFSRLSWNWQS